MQINLSYKQVNYELLSLPFIAETLTTFWEKYQKIWLHTLFLTLDTP
jgi:hypothetical protein